jgi:hypothetical protein
LAKSPAVSDLHHLRGRVEGPLGRRTNAPGNQSVYPTFVSPNIVVKALFNPNVKYQDLIQVQSELTPAYGIWKVIKLDLDLEAKVPHGKWFLIAEAINAKAVTPDQ